MKLAFTTLGCPDWNLDTIISNAVEFGYHGVDFRGYLGELDIIKLPEFSTNIKETSRRFREASLEIPCFSSSIRLFTTSNAEFDQYFHELRSYAQLCQHFNTPYIRVFGGEINDTERTKAVEIVIENLLEMLKIAEAFNVTLIIETHDDWTKCEFVTEIVERVNSDYFHVLWDVHHPFRTVGEDPLKTWNTLGKWIKYTHWKDSYIKKDTERGYQLCLLGEGDVPLQRMLHLLIEKGYDGYFTLEWEKKWCPEIEEPEIAFKRYIEFMKENYFGCSNLE
jgi:sugar phosphate isomerase/epimerase